jgi:hypothetical protein
MDKKRVACELLKLAKDLTAKNVYRRFYFVNNKIIHLEWFQHQDDLTTINVLLKEALSIDSIMDKELKRLLKELDSYKFETYDYSDTFVGVEKGKMFTRVSVDISTKQDIDEAYLKEFFSNKGFFYKK